MKEECINIQLSRMNNNQIIQWGMSHEQMCEMEKLYLENDRLGEFYDNLLNEGYELLYSKLTSGKCNQIIYALNKNIKINYDDPYQKGYNPTKDEYEKRLINL